MARRSYPVTFEVRFVEARGQRTIKGGLMATPELMRQAFRHGRAHLELDGGERFEIDIVAHAEGSPTAYFESAAPR